MSDVDDVVSRTKEENCIITKALTASQNGLEVDRTNFRSVAFVISMGAPGEELTDTLAIQFYLEHRNKGESFAAVTDANDVIGADTIPAGLLLSVEDFEGGDRSWIFQYRGPKKYARVNVVFVGSHTASTPICVVALNTNSNSLPI